MTIRIIRKGSLGLEPGAIRTLSTATESALVADKEAVYATATDSLAGPVVSDASGNLFANGKPLPPVSGAANSNYLFYIPGRQGTGAPTDYSGQGRDAILDTGLSQAELWATPGYMTSVAGSDKQVAVVSAAVADNWVNQVVVIAHRVKMAAPGSNAAYAGFGANATPHGIYFSARTNGQVQVIATSAAGLYAPGDVPGVVFDNTEHSIATVLDGPNKTLRTYIDGGLARYDTNITLGAASNLAAGFAIGGSQYTAGSQTTVASVTREWHMLKFSTLPLNLDAIMLKLASQSGALTAADVRF